LYDRYFYKGDPPCCEEVDSPDVLEIREEAPSRSQPEREEKDRKRFHNNPFEDLKGKNLDLF
jgi:3'-5' exoribonuclease